MDEICRISDKKLPIAYIDLETLQDYVNNKEDRKKGLDKQPRNSSQLMNNHQFKKQNRGTIYIT